MNAATRRLLQTQIVSTAELVALTGLPMITLQKWAERDQVDCVKKGRTLLFDRRDFADHIAEHIAGHLAGREGPPGADPPAGARPAGAGLR